MKVEKQYFVADGQIVWIEKEQAAGVVLEYCNELYTVQLIDRERRISVTRDEIIAKGDLVKAKQHGKWLPNCIFYAPILHSYEVVSNFTVVVNGDIKYIWAVKRQPEEPAQNELFCATCGQVLVDDRIYSKGVATMLDHRGKTYIWVGPKTVKPSIYKYKLANHGEWLDPDFWLQVK